MNIAERATMTMICLYMGAIAGEVFGMWEALLRLAIFIPLAILVAYIGAKYEDRGSES